MDIATILGLVMGILVVLKVAGGAAGLYQGTGLLVVVAGGIAALLIAFPLRQVLNVFAVVKTVFFKKMDSPLLLIRRAVSFSETARREGILALETAVSEDDDPFLRQGTRLAVDGTEPDLIMDILETELQFIEARHKRNQDMLERLGRYWAIFGVVGALLVLVQGSGEAGGTLVAQAALPLLYGALLYGLVGGPFGRKLQAYSENEVLVKRMTIEAIMAIQSGDNPRIVEHKLAVFVAPKCRPSDPAPAPAPPPAEEDHTREEMEKFLAEKQDLVLRLVREAAQASEAPAAQKTQVEEAAGKFERGEISLVALLVLLTEEVRNEILHTIKNPPPPLVDQVPPRDFDFEAIGKLSDREIQMLMREVDQRDLVVAMKGASDEFKEKVLGNMSERVRTFIVEEMSYMRVQPEDVLDTQTRIVKQVFQLEERGQITLV
jgi:chemotaxis protein MotA